VSLFLDLKTLFLTLTVVFFDLLFDKLVIGLSETIYQHCYFLHGDYYVYAGLLFFLTEFFFKNLFVDVENFVEKLLDERLKA